MDLKASSCAARFQDRVVLVTGVGGGAGLATALRLGLEGARVVSVARSDANVTNAKRVLGAHGVTFRALQGDVSTDAGAAGAVAEAQQAFGKLDALVNCAGGYEAGDLGGTDAALLERMLALNLRTAFHTALAAAPSLQTSGHGAIVIVAAVFGALVPGPGLLAYNTSKTAAAGFAASLAGELAPRGVRVNAILPGGITHDFDPGRDAAANRVLGKGPALPQDVAAAAAFLASDDAAWITGASLVVDGGFSVSRRFF